MLTANRPPSTFSALPRHREGPSLWLLGVLAIVGSAVVNWLVDSLIVAFLPISAEFSDLQILKVEPFTIVGALGAVLVFAVVDRLSSHPNRVYWWVATCVLLLSAVPDIAMLSGPGATPLAVSALFFLHITTYVVCVGVLTNRTHMRWRASSSRTVASGGQL
jgi:Family of unknown function (DUF6069)